MLGTIVLFLSACTLGTALLRVLRIRPASILEVLLHSVCAGLGVWSCLLFVMGHLFLFRPWILVSLSIALALPAPLLLYHRLRGEFNPRAALRAITRIEIVLLCFTGVILALRLVTSFAPVVGGIRNDEILTHLTMPREWMLHGGLADIPFSISYQAGNAHLLFLLASCFSPQSGPHLVSWLSLVLCLVAVNRLTRSFASRRTAIIAMAVAAVNPLIFRGADVALVDLESTLFIIAPLCTLAIYARERRGALLALCGFYLAIGCGLKLTNIVYATAMIAAASAWWTIARQGLPGLMRGLLILCAAAVVFGAPWSVRNLLLTGSPTFPPPLLLYRMFEVKPLSGTKAPYTFGEVKSFHDYCNSRFGTYRRTVSNFLRLPWDVTMKPEQFQIGDSIGTLLLSFLPLSLLFLPLPGAIWGLSGFAVLSALLLYFGVLPESRYYMGVLMALSPVIAFTIDRLSAIKRVAAVSWAVVAANMFFSLSVAARTSVTPVKTLMSRQFRDAYVQANQPFFEAFRFIDSQGLTNVRVCYPSQLFYYLGARCIVEPDVMKRQPETDGVYVLDIDYSQVGSRDLAALREDYCYPSPPPYAHLVFKGPDARVYRLDPVSDLPE